MTYSNTKLVGNIRKGYKIVKKGNKKQMKSVAQRLGMQTSLALESRYVDTTFFAFGVPAAGSVSTLNQIAQGDDLNNRQGRSVHNMNILYRYNIVAGDATNIVRHAIVYDKLALLGVPSFYDVFNDLALNNSVIAPVNPRNSTRFVILSDNITRVETNNIQKGGKIYKKLNNILTSFTDGTANTHVVGRLLLVCASDSGAVTHPTIQFSTRLRYRE